MTSRTLLPIRHPNRDFFILDVSDASPKNDIASMEHPIYSLSVKPSMRVLEYNHRGKRIIIEPSNRGLATILDKDILLYCISLIVHKKNHCSSENDLSPWVEFRTHEAMAALNWRTNKASYSRFEDALFRLRNTAITTNVETGGIKETKGFGLIDAYDIIRIDKEGELDPFGRRSIVRVKISEWTMRAIRQNEVLTISPQYFRLRRPLERRIYEIGRKHTGNQKRSIPIGFETLRKKVGSNSSLSKFKYFIKQIIEDGNIPDIDIWIDDENVMFRKRVTDNHFSRVRLRVDTVDKAKAMAVERGLDYSVIENEWHHFINKKGMPENPDGAFIGFIKKKKRIRKQSDLF
jgi:plasmid replication initiation protein